MDKKPKVTVLMPVYNGEKYLCEAMDSILNQTFTDFEFLIINDGSTDNSVRIIESYQDPRIRLVHNERNIHLIRTLNKGLELAKGEYVARMDCDDISHPERLKKQVQFMDEHLEVGVCGTWVDMFSDPTGESSIWYSPIDSEELKIHLLFETALAHPSVLLRLSSLNRYNLSYAPEDLYAEDYGLWVRCSCFFPMCNIPEALVRYRINSMGITQTHRCEQKKSVTGIRRRYLSMLGINANDLELEIHNHIAENGCMDMGGLGILKHWFQKLYEANTNVSFFSEPLFSEFLCDRWLLIWRSQKKLNLQIAKLFNDTPDFLRERIKTVKRFEFSMKCFRRQFLKRHKNC